MKIEELDKNMAVKDPESGLEWYDASKLTIEGMGWETTDLFTRLPDKAQGVVRDEVWSLSRNSSGIAICFTSSTPSLAVRWDGFGAMDHMPATGVSGVDLYVKHEGAWKWLAIGRPKDNDSLNETQLFSNLSAEKREFMLYLPLYNAVNTIQLGIPESYTLAPATSRVKPIVFYGTSITQGGCASRPGMCYSAIIGRKCDVPVINLGFSGNGKMEPEVIDLLAELEPSIYVIDALPNNLADEVYQLTAPLVRKLRTAHPNTPIVLVDNICYCDSFLVHSRRERYLTSNKAQFAVYEELLAEGMTGLYYVKDEGLIGLDGEATVDGTHLTDLGYIRFSEALLPLMQELLAKDQDSSA